MRLGAQTTRHLDQPLGIRAVIRAHDQQQIGVGGNVLNSNLPILRGIADILRRRALDVGKALAQRGDNVARLIQAERGLRQVSYAVGIGQRYRRNFRGRADNLRHRWRLAESSNDLVVIAMANQNQRIAFLRKLDGLDVDLGDQWASRVDHPQLARLACLAHLWRNAVRAIDDALALGHFFNTVDKNRAFLLQLLDHKAVVDNFFAHINWASKSLERNADNINRPHHPGAESARLQEEQS